MGFPNRITGSSYYDSRKLFSFAYLVSSMEDGIIIDASIVAKIGQLFKLPRNYAFGYQGRWSRFHEQINVQDLFLQMKNDQSVCVSMKDTNEKGEYSDKMSFCVFDIDNRDNIEHAKQCCFILASYLMLELRIPCLITFSGGKGFHVFVFFDRSIDEMRVAKFQFFLVRCLGYNRSATEEYIYDNTHIETLIATGKGRVVKIPFSPHPAHSGRFEIPISLTDVLTFNPEAPLNWENAKKQLGKATHCEASRIETIASQVVEHDFVSVRGNLNKHRVKIAPFICPENAPRQDEILFHVLTTPCLRYCFETAKTKSQIYSLRVNIVVALAKMVFTPVEIAVFIRDNINDDEDNAHVGMNESQVAYWYSYTHLCKCATFKRKKLRNFCCQGYCGKSDPSKKSKRYTHEDYAEFDKIIAERKKNEPLIQMNTVTDENKEEIMDMCDDIIALNTHVQVYKTTRAGVTTSLVLSAIKNGKRVIVLEPTTELCENKMKEIMNVSQTFYSDSIAPFRGIALTDNRKMCLDLAENVINLRRQFNVEHTEYDKFPFIIKKKCDKCFYRNFEVPFVAGVPLSRSNVIDKQCALVTILKRIPETSVLSMTYSKFQALLLANNDGSTYANDLVSQLLVFDIIIFDEFSHFTDTPVLDVLIESTWVDGRKAYDMLERIKTTMTNIKRWKRNNNTLERLDVYSDRFASVIKQVINNIDKNAIKLERILNEDDTVDVQINMMIYLKPLIDYMEARNESVLEVYNMLQMVEDSDTSIAITNTPGIDYQREISAKKTPMFDEVKAFVSLFHQHNGKVIVTDATMPIATPESVFGILFSKYNVGDPKNTAKMTAFFPDNWEFFGKYPNVDEQLVSDNIVVSRLKSIFKYYNPKNVLIVTPSILLNQRVVAKMREEGYSNLNITYQRSDITIGKDCPYRVMVMIGTPYAPRNAFEWVKVFDKSVDDGVLWEWNARKWAFQSASRVKDPNGIETSVVFGIGIPYGVATKMFDSNHLINPPYVEFSEKTFDRQVLKSLYWKKYEQLPDDFNLDIMQRMANQQPITEQMSGTQYEFLRNAIKSYS